MPLPEEGGLARGWISVASRADGDPPDRHGPFTIVTQYAHARGTGFASRRTDPTSLRVHRSDQEAMTRRSAVVCRMRELRGERAIVTIPVRSEEHTSELQSLRHLVCRLLLE